MRIREQQRRTFGYLLTAALILSQFAAFLALPRSASAALSADPNAEIVYIDNNKFIRVLDTQGDPLIQWSSPDNGWDQIVLLDVDDDGDMEILALDNVTDTALRIAVFDPVVAFGAIDPNKQINGVPWDTLWEGVIEGNAEYIVGGDFDPGIPGDEFAVGYRVGNISVVRIYNANSLGSNGKPTGRDWKVHFERAYPDVEYKYGISGQLSADGAEELILFDADSAVSRMDVFRPDQDMILLDSQTSSNDSFKFGAAGQLEAGGNEELVAILTVRRPDRTSLRTYVLGSNGELSEDERWAFAPQPEWVFLADIRGNGDKEIFFLRNYPADREGARLIMRDDWGDDRRQNQDLIEWKLMDGGSKNEFRAGVGADVDGDGRDEVILLRNDRIRIYHRPENGNESSANYDDYMVNTDNQRINLLAGDLDRNGFTSGPVLMVSNNLIEAIVPAGTSSRDFTVNVTNIGAEGSIGINAIVPPGSPWVILPTTFASTPATFRVRFDATSLQPGIYSTTMTLIASGANVVNNNFVVHLRLTVIPPTLQPNPPILSVYRLPCANDPCSAEEIAERNQPITKTIRINGSTDLAFRAALIGVPPAESAAVASVTGGLPGPIAGGEIDENGNIVIYDAEGNRRTLVGEQVSASATHTGTLIIDPELTWIESATLDSNVAPATLTLVMSPTVLTGKFDREHAVLVLVADTRAGTPNGNVVLVPIELANIGDLTWISLIIKGD